MAVVALPLDEVVAARRPRLVVAERGSRVVWVMAGVATTVCLLLMFAAVLRTHLAEQQLKLDGINKSVSMARDHYNDLRHERTFLVSPDRLSSEAAKLGMRPAGQSRFVSVDPDIIAVVLASTGNIADKVADKVDSSLDEFGRIKSEVGSAQ